MAVGSGSETHPNLVRRLSRTHCSMEVKVRTLIPELSSASPDVSAQPEYSLLREEAKKSWQHSILDELVYVTQVEGPKVHPCGDIAKIYLKGDIWIEVKFMLAGQRDAQYCAIIQVFDSDVAGIGSGKPELNLGTIRRDSPMLVKVTHSVQPPKVVGFRGCRSICWLKLFNNGDGVYGNSREIITKLFGASIVPFCEDRELGVFRNSHSQFGETPDQLVKAGAHTVKRIPTPQADFVGNVVKLDPNYIPSIFKVFLTNNSAGVSFVELQEVIVQRFQMSLRPIQLQIRIG